MLPCVEQPIPTGLCCLCRCVHAVKVGWQVCKPGVTEEEKAYVLFLSHDISMLRLFETFLETAPQLTFVLYVILQTNEIELFQGEWFCWQEQGGLSYESPLYGLTGWWHDPLNSCF